MVQTDAKAVRLSCVVERDGEGRTRNGERRGVRCAQGVCVDTRAPCDGRRRVGGVPRTATPVRLYLRSSPSVLRVLCLAGAGAHSPKLGPRRPLQTSALL